jgi:UDP-glucose 4-epimerase
LSVILITGGCGFLGWNITRGLAQAGEKVICYDVKEPDSRLVHWKNEKIKIIKGDVGDLKKVCEVVEDEKVEKIVHGGAILGYSSNYDEIRQYIKTNIEGTLNILEAMRIGGTIKGVYLSSEEVYGTFQSTLANETHQIDPVGIYAITKYTGESLINLYHNEHDIDCLILRTCWVYGPGLPRERPPWFLVEKAVKGEKGFIKNGADQLSDKTYIDDLVCGVQLALSSKKTRHRTFNIASGQLTTLGQMVEMIGKIVPGAQIIVGPGLLDNSDRVKLPQKGALDITRAREELGYKPRYDLEKGLRAYIEWLSEVN